MGGGGKGGSAPKPPDYVAAAEAQGQANLEAARATAKLSNPNYITPYGTRTVTYGSQGGPSFNQRAYDRAMDQYEKDLQLYNTRARSPRRIGGGQKGQIIGGYGSGAFGPAPQAPDPNQFYFNRGDPDVPTITDKLSPENQALYEQDRRIAQQVQDVAEGLSPRVAESYQDPFPFQDAVDVRDRVEQALLERMTRYSDRDLENRRTQLQQAGILPGTEAWQREMDDYNRLLADQRLSAIVGAGTEQDRALQTAAFLRDRPYNEQLALRQGAPIQSPQFGAYQGAGVGPAPYFNAVNQQYGQELGAYNAEQARNAQQAAGLYGLGGAALSSPWLGGVFGKGAKPLTGYFDKVIP